MKTTSKLLIIIAMATAGAAALLIICRRDAAEPDTSNTASLAVPNQAVRLPLADQLILKRSAHTDEALVVSRTGCNAATLGILHAVLTGDQQQLLHFRRLLLTSEGDISGHLARLLTCGITEVEVEAMRLLIQTGKDRAMAMVLGRMLNIDLSNEDAGLYTAVFSQCRHVPLTDWLVSCLDDSANELLRHRAAVLLSILQGPETVISICLPLETATVSTGTQKSALELMDSRTAPSEVAALIEVFKATSVPELRESVAFSLAGIGSVSAAQFLVDTALRDGDDAFIARAALATISSSQAQQALLSAALNKELPEETRIAAVSSLHLQSSAHVATALANIDITPSHSELNKAIEIALDQYNRKSTPPSDAGIILGESHEICF